MATDTELEKIVVAGDDAVDLFRKLDKQAKLCDCAVCGGELVVRWNSWTSQYELCCREHPKAGFRRKKGYWELYQEGVLPYTIAGHFQKREEQRGK